MNTHLRMGLSLAMVSLLGLTACGSELDGACTTESRSSVTVNVVDAAGAVVKDAVVTFTVDGGAVETCDSFPDATDYTCGRDRKGKFIITATKGADTKTETVTITTTTDGCHVEGQTITMKLGV